MNPDRDSGAGTNKRILFVCHEASRTGAPMFLLHLLRWLRANTPVQFDILLGQPGPLEAEFAALAKIHSPQSLAQPGALAPYDLIYSNTCCNGLLLESLPPHGIPVITHFHELDFGYEALGARRLGAVIKQSDRYVACAEAVARGMQQAFNLSRELIDVHYEMIVPELVVRNASAKPASEIRQHLGIPEGTKLVVGCGTFDWRKAPDLFLQVAANVRRRLGPDIPLQFLWVGKNNDPLLALRLKYDARHAGLNRELRFLGEFDNPHGVLALADVFCLTSREDPFPLAMLEAAALEKPVVCFDNAGGGAEFCALGGGFAVPFLNTAAMAERCHALLTDETLRAAIGRRGAEVVRSRFTAETVAPALYRDIEQFRKKPRFAAAFRGPNTSLAEVFASWPAKECPDPEYVEVYLSRATARREAQQAVRQGKKTEAVQILSRFVAGIAQTKRGNIVLESVVEIAEDLKSLDRPRSQYLLAEAEKIARMIGSPLEQYRPKVVSPAPSASAAPPLRPAGAIA